MARKPTLVLLVGSLGVGGAERHMLSLAHGLADRMRVVLVYVKDDHSLGDQIDHGRVDEVHCLDAGSGWDRAAVGRLRRILARLEADVVLCANLYPLFYACAAARGLRPRPRMIEVFHTTRPTGRNAWVRTLRYLPLVWVADRVIFVCQAQRTYWQRRGMWARRVSVIHNGVDIDRFGPPQRQDRVDGRTRHGFAADDLVVGLCAAMRPEKAHTHLLDAIALVDRAGGPCWKALFVGDGPERAEIERHAARVGLSDRVVITGARDDVRPELAVCDVAAIVSTSETFSIAALEAMAMGLSLIISDVGGAREQVVPGVTGWAFPAGDREALARCLVQASDRSQRRRMGEAGRERAVRLFSLPGMLGRYSETLEADAARRVPGRLRESRRLKG